MINNRSTLAGTFTQNPHLKYLNYHFRGMSAVYKETLAAAVMLLFAHLSKIKSYYLVYFKYTRLQPNSRNEHEKWSSADNMEKIHQKTHSHTNKSYIRNTNMFKMSKKCNLSVIRGQRWCPATKYQRGNENILPTNNKILFSRSCLIQRKIKK